MAFHRFVQPGRVAYIAEGPNSGKLCTIVDVVDQTRALIDGPETGIPRQEINFNRLHLTKFRFKIPHTAPSRIIKAAWNKAEVTKKWEASKWCRRVSSLKRRKEMTDFDRFKLRHARMHRNKITKSAFRVMARRAIRDGLLKKPKPEELAKIRAEHKAAKKARKAPFLARLKVVQAKRAKKASQKK